MLRLSIEDKTRLERLIYNMLHEMQEKERGYRITISNGVAELLLFAARVLQAQSQSIDESQSPLVSKINDITQYISNHFRETLTLNELSRRFHLSPSYLSEL